MPTHLPAAPDAGGRVWAPPPLAWRGATARAIGRLARSWTRRRSPSSLHLALHEFSDHMLADVGLVREPRTIRGVRSPESWFLAAHPR